MKLTQFSNTSLALAIAAISTPVAALDVDLSQGKTLWLNETINESLTATGQVSRVIDTNTTDPAGLGFANTHIMGSLTNRADITLDAQGRTIGAFSVDPNFWRGSSNLSPGSISGDLVQAGNLLMINGARSGLEVGQTTIGGSIINSGTIRSTPPAPDSTHTSADEGIYLHGTTIAGDFLNSGVVDMAGDHSTGLIIDASQSRQFTLAGKLINSGTIRVTGNDVWAIDVETDTTPLRIENSGLISADGASSKGMVFFEGTIDYLLNTGTIEAKGINATGIELGGATFAQTTPSGARGIVNRGTLSAQGTAIRVIPGDQVSSFEINQQGGEIRSASGVAISAANLASLNWTGGRITGDLLGLTAVNIAGQAEFVGSRINAPVSINAGSLNLTAPGSAITGDLTVASGGGIDMRLSDSVSPTAAYLTVNGAAAFAPNSRITLSANPGDFTPSAAGASYRLVEATSVRNDGLTVASASSLLEVESFTSDAQSVTARVVPRSDQQVQNDLSGVGVGASAITAVNVLKNDVLGQLDANDPLFLTLASATSAQQLAQVAEQLQPDISRGALELTLAGQHRADTALFDRLSAQRGVSGGTGVWIQGISGDIDQDRRDGVSGYSLNSSGVAVGVDGRINDNVLLGVAYSHLNGNVRSDVGHKTEVRGNALSVYGDWSLDRWFVSGNLGYGRNEYDSTRHSAGSTAKGRYDGDVLSAGLVGGYGFKVTDALLVEPRVAARYAHVSMDGFTEKGSSAALDTGSQRYETGEVGAGLRVAGNWPLGAGSLQPEVALMAWHDLIGDPVVQTSRYAAGSSAFSVTGASVARDSYEASLGVNYRVAALSVGASYNREARSGLDGQSVVVKAQYAF